MNTPHDIGGMHGLGAVPWQTDEPVFHADWERTIFSIMLALAGQGRFNADHFRSAREKVPAHRYLTSRYYELWLQAVERLVADVVAPDEIERWAEQLRQDPDVPVPRALDADLADALERGLREGLSTAGPVPHPRRYAVGDPVRTRNVHPPGHTRLPRYARDKEGVVDALYPAFPLPDRADDGDYRPEYLYCVRFAAEELWGDSAEPGCEVQLDMWESYLRPVDDPPSVTLRQEESR
ncbi:MAG: nitrile hydratase subunit beta [Nitriliruptorales bacterium]|nr:nitrile hydratase subunit beta [Nitriliruptorales bacterium]